MTLALRRNDDPEVRTADGASARVEPDGETLSVRDRSGRLLFQYDAATGRGTLLVPEGDLRLSAPKGAIELEAAKGIRAVTAGELSLSGDTLCVEARESRLRLGEAHAWADSLHTVVERAELRFGQLVRRAERVIEQADNVYQRVSELYELKAGRLRSLVKEGIWFKGNELTLLANKDVRVDGEHINLG